MGDFGKIGIIGGYAQINSKEYGKIGAEYSYQKEFDSNPDIGYKLACKANALIGKGNIGGSAGVYAGLDFAKTQCTQYNLGLMADYTRAGEKSFKTSDYTVDYSDNFKVLGISEGAHHTLRAGGELGFTRNLCCDENQKLHIALQGGAEFAPKIQLVDENNGTIEVNYPEKLNNIKPFMGAKAEYSTVVNNKGNEIFFRGDCQLSKHNSQGSVGIGFRF